MADHDREFRVNRLRSAALQCERGQLDAVLAELPEDVAVLVRDWLGTVLSRAADVIQQR